MKEQTLPKGWREVRLSEVCTFQKGKGLSKKEIKSNGKYPCILYGELFTKYSGRIKDVVSRTDDIDEKFLSEKGDILMPSSDVTPNGLATASVLYENGIILGGDIIVIRSSKGKMDSLFFSFYVKANKPDILKLASGTTVFHIYKSDLARLKIPLPPLPEQKAIASLLETWDTAIEKTEALIAAKQKQFEWLVKILIEKNQYKSEWQRNTLDNLFEIYTYSSKSKFVSNNGELFIVDMGAVSRKGDLIANKRTNSNADILQVHDLVMPKDDIGGGNIIGKVAIIEDKDRYICSDHVYRLVPKSKNNTYFIRFLINSFSINRKLRAKANGTSQLGLSKQAMASQQVWLPLITKQNAIVQTLNTSQQEITLLKQLAEQYRIQKRGLMQKLLTGKWRLKT